MQPLDLFTFYSPPEHFDILLLTFRLKNHLQYVLLAFWQDPYPSFAFKSSEMFHVHAFI